MKEIKIYEKGGEGQKKKNIFFRPLPKRIWLGSLIILLLAGVLFAYWVMSTNDLFQFIKNKSGYQFEEDKIDPNDTPCPLDGVMTTKERAERRPLGIMIENHPGARPQSGLDKASFVFETPAEGGITRFLAFFVENDVSEVGPVRSARTYFVDWAQEVKSVYAHCGGSVPALAQLRGISDSFICDINQFYYGPYFWREKGRSAPHNLYTTTEELRKAVSKADCEQKGSYEGYNFKEDAGKEIRPEEQVISIDFSSPAYEVVYRYNKENNHYLREQGGEAHKDSKSGEQIAPKTVVIMKTSRKLYYQNGIELWKVTTTGTGNAEVFMDGQRTVCTWERESINERTRFYDSSGQELLFNRGQIWVEVVSSGMTVSTSP